MGICGQVCVAIGQEKGRGKLLQLAKERNVRGVAKLFGHRDLETTADMRDGLQFGRPKIFAKMLIRDEVENGGWLRSVAPV